MLLTIFTPTYNRAHLLPCLYESLCSQKDKDFEWVVVDDGSRDETKTVIESFLRDERSQFPIRYFYQENGGKHRAINRGIREAKGELQLILDSDDSLPNTAVATIRRYYDQIKDDMSFGGVCGRMAHNDGTMIGQSLPQPVLDTDTIGLEYHYGIIADVCEVFRTSVWREFPFPEIPNERFCPENLVLHRIASKYKMRVFDEVVYTRDYLEGGLTDRIVRIRMNSPVTSATYYGELSHRNIPFVSQLKTAVNYYRFLFCVSDKDKKKMIPKVSGKWFCVKPLGYLMHLRDKMITKA